MFVRVACLLASCVLLAGSPTLASPVVRLSKHLVTASSRSSAGPILGDNISKLGIKGGVNAGAPGPLAWFGTNGDYTVAFHNGGNSQVGLVIWGPNASWVNANQPLITHDMNSGDSITVSFAMVCTHGHTQHADRA